MSIRLHAVLRCVALLVLGWVAGPASAGPADISNVPLSTMTTTSVRPNLMFILDDSGSMASDYLPDSVNNNNNNACFGEFSYNRVFFNPATTYTLPRRGDGTNSYPNASFTAALNDGFNASSGTTNLSNLLDLPWTYVVSQTTVDCTKGQAGCSASTSSNATAGTETVATISSCNGANDFSCKKTTTVYQHYYYTKRVTGTAGACNSNGAYTAVTSLTAAEQQAYANWFQYYRTRMLMMRSASGRVFDAIDPTRYRVGFSTISYTGTANGSDFLNIDNFDAGSGTTAQKALFFSKLYGNPPSGSTPLRPALVKAGQYFAKKATNQAVDPMQYSCQRNYTLLSTDGYWNTAAEPSQPSYVPKRLDGTTPIGDVDGVAGTPRPQLDTFRAANSLSDIAKYFYDTDLRTTALGNCTGSVAGQDVCVNATPKPGDTVPVFQNMTTYTLGLGVPGVLNYQNDYDTATTGDYQAIVAGSKNWPDPLSSSASGYANTGNTVTARIDDLWHAAVNGGGRYYSAGSPDDLVVGLTDALAKIEAKDGANASAATSTLKPVAGDDWVFLPGYETKTWVGELSAYRFSIDPVTGRVSVTNAPVWKASRTIAQQSSRRIVMFDGAATNKLKDFTYSNLNATQRTWFDNLCGTTPKLAQCGTMTTNARSRVTGGNVIDYLRGNRQYELYQGNPDDRLFRSRLDQDGNWTPLGDVVNGSPAYARVPPFKYVDSGYAGFKASQLSRTGVVYLAANDGMLHAIRASDGVELWAYVPTAVIPEMWRLADKNFSTSHRYYVDATPVIADVYDGSSWRTILVGGLGAGGKMYYAIDVTDPSTPKALWEFTDANLGLTYGNPVIGKNKTGTWVVAFTSGYNNAGDGNGRLYVLNAISGQPELTAPLQTQENGANVGTVATPNNLGPINAWVTSEENNTIDRIYGGDMFGNVWRFDFDDKVAPSGREAFLLAKVTAPGGAPQPITTLPLLSEVEQSGLKVPVVTVATGRYLGATDLGDTTVNSIYSFKDPMDGTAPGTLRSNTGMVAQPLNSSRSQSSTASVNWSTQTGWYTDFNQTAGERVNVEMDVQLGIVTVATTIPTPTPCSPGGTSWLYYFDVSSGKVLRTYQSPTLIVGFGNVLEKAGTSDQRMTSVVAGSDGSLTPYEAPDGGGSGSTPGGVRRTAWRELVN